MKISVDTGSLCSQITNRFGNYVFTRNLLQAVSHYDKRNEYILYTFCNKNKNNLGLNSNFKFKKLKPNLLWSSVRVPMEEIFEYKDIHLALNQSVPSLTFSKIISFSHGLSFLYFPDLYPDSAKKMSAQIKLMMEKSKWIIVSSKKVREEFLQFYPKLQNIKVINFGVPQDMLNFKQIKKEKYFLFVGMNHKIKNIDFIIKAFKELVKDKVYLNFKLYLVGPFSEYKGMRGIRVIDQYITRAQLKKYYSKATGYLTASLYESFNLPVLESLVCGTKVVALESAIIPELEKYAIVCQNNKEFLNGMKSATLNPKHNFRKEIIKKFSWKKYAENLIKLYD